jgi:hypothetical protein
VLRAPELALVMGRVKADPREKPGAGG